MTDHERTASPGQVGPQKDLDAMVSGIVKAIRHLKAALAMAGLDEEGRPLAQGNTGRANPTAVIINH